MSRLVAVRVLEGHARSYRHTWRGTTISAVVTPVLFLAAIGLGLGSLIDAGGAPAGLGDVSYLAWLAPGLLAASTMQNGAADGAFPVVAGMRWAKTYHAALNTPVRPRDLLLGNLAWAAIRGAVTGSSFVVVVPLFLFSGEFFPITQLPDVVQPLVVASPVWHGVELARALALGTDPVHARFVHVAVLAGLLLVGAAGAIAVFERKLRR